MSRSLILSFNSAVTKYSRLSRKVRKSIRKGEFWRLTKRKRQHLLHRIENLRHRIYQLGAQLKLAGVGIAAGLMLMASGEASAQGTPLGPFTLNPAKNPLPPPVIPHHDFPAVTLWDYDNDGKPDITLSTGDFVDFDLKYYKNNSTGAQLQFDQIDAKGGLDVSYSGNTYTDPARVAYADIDNDGDDDMAMVTAYGGTVYFYRNDGTAAAPQFNYVESDSPFEGINTRYGSVAFSDVDADGDLDLVVGGYYYDANTGLHPWVQYFRNDPKDNDPGTLPSYTQVKGEDNPFYYDDTEESTDFISVAFTDIDGDGDEDFFYAVKDGIHYRRNDNGVFNEQEGAYDYKPGGESTGNPLEIDGLELNGFETYRGLAFGDIDGDADDDLLIATKNPGTLSPSYFFVENTGNGVMSFNEANPFTGFTMGSNSNPDISVFDYDGDGDLDLMTTGSVTISHGETSDSELTRILFKNDNGKFSQTSDDPFPGVILPKDGTATAVDVDGDGDIDLAVRSRTHDSESESDIDVLSFYRNDQGVYTLYDETDPFDFVDSEDIGFKFQFGDVNADGLPDVIYIGNDAVIRLYQNVGSVENPAYEENTDWEKGFVISNGEGGFYDITASEGHPRFIDIDSDGDLDIVMGKYNSIWYFQNTGDSANPVWLYYPDASSEGNSDVPTTPNPFGNLFHSGENMSHINLNVADFDGDGDRDLIFNTSRDGNFAFYENQNLTPIITVDTQDINFSVNQPVNIAPSIALSDPDGDLMSEVRLTLTPYVKGQEKLQMADGFESDNLVTTWDDDKGILTIVARPLGDIAAFEIALQSVQYLYTGSDPDERKSGHKAANGRTLAKTITVYTLDSDFTIGTTNTTAFNVGHSNVAPAITPASVTADYTSTDIAISPSIVVTDGDDATLEKATVSFDAATYSSSEDRLKMLFTGDITAAFNVSTGVLTLTGTSSVANYQAALRTVVYSNLKKASATPGDRTINIVANDGESNSNVASTQVSLSLTNTPPTISGVAVNAFYINTSVVISDQVSVNDVDNVILGATVSIASGFNAGEDQLLYTDQPNVTGSYNATTGVLTLSGIGSVADYQSALRSVQYKNTSATPDTSDRGITFTVTDGSATASLTGTVVRINKPPVVDTPDKKGAGAGSTISFAISRYISDPDNNLDLTTLEVTSQKGIVNIDGGIITIDYSGNPTYTGSDIITIAVCDLGGRCQTKTINIDVGADPVVYTGMSPNGDGVNDWFHIEYLSPNTHVVVYDRWGDAIYDESNYDVNDPAKRFEGKNKNGNDVVAGTYFYKVKYPEPNGSTKQGYILLNR